MLDLESQISDCVSKLKNLSVALQKDPVHKLPSKCLERWEERTLYYQNLENTIDLYRARVEAWDQVKGVEDSTVVKKELDKDIVKFGDTEMDFVVARHLALVSYMAVSWAIYDRLSNVCGRISGVSKLADNPKQNPKACEGFLGNRELLGFSAHLHLKETYQWPLKVSYKIRNWLVHEGYFDGPCKLFASNRITNSFELDQNAIDHIQECCAFSEDDGKIQYCCVDAADDPWSKRQLLDILKCYHAEIDKMFASFLKWSVDALVSQVITFSDR